MAKKSRKAKKSGSNNEGALLQSMSNEVDEMEMDEIDEEDLDADEMEMLQEMEDSVDEDNDNDEDDDILEDADVQLDEEIEANLDDEEVEEDLPKAKSKPKKKAPKKKPRKKAAKSATTRKKKKVETSESEATEEVQHELEASPEENQTAKKPRKAKKAKRAKAKKAPAKVTKLHPDDAETADSLENPAEEISPLERIASAMNRAMEIPSGTTSEISAEDSQNTAPPQDQPIHAKRPDAFADEHLEKELREDVSVATVTMHKSMESMVKQWGSVKDISNSIVENFEQVSKMMHELPRQSIELHEKVRRRANRPNVSTKVAIAASIIAVVMSVVSLSLASSIRRSVLSPGEVTAMTPRATHSASQAKIDPPVKTSKKESMAAVMKEEPAKTEKPKILIETAERPTPKINSRTRPRYRKQIARKSRLAAKRAKLPVYTIKWKKRGGPPSN